MSERQEKKRRFEQKLQYLNKLEAWLAEEPAWWRISARKRWKARKPKKPKNFRMNYLGGRYAGQ